MQIETYEVEELKASEATIMACDAESMELIAKLGLTGQQSINNSETLTRQPYPEMTAEEAFVYGFHLPEKTPLKDYRLSPIPLRVLQCAAYVTENNLFVSLKVWHPKQIKDDPLLVGYKDATWNARPHMIARWGSTLKPYPELASLALDGFTSQIRLAAEKIKRQAERLIADCDLDARVRFAKQDFDIPVAYHLD